MPNLTAASIIHTVDPTQLLAYLSGTNACMHVQENITSLLAQYLLKCCRHEYINTANQTSDILQ